MTMPRGARIGLATSIILAGIAGAVLFRKPPGEPSQSPPATFGSRPARRFSDSLTAAPHVASAPHGASVPAPSPPRRRQTGDPKRPAGGLQFGSAGRASGADSARES